MFPGHDLAAMLKDFSVSIITKHPFGNDKVYWFWKTGFRLGRTLNVPMALPCGNAQRFLGQCHHKTSIGIQRNNDFACELTHRSTLQNEDLKWNTAR